MWPNATTSRPRMSVVLIFTLLILPSAQPFASGSSGSSAAPPFSHQPWSSNHPTTANSFPSQSQPSLSRTTAAAVTAVASSPDATLPESQGGIFRKFWHKVRRGRGRPPPKSRTQTGEYSVSLPSRLLYQYATPLLRKASSGDSLDATDAMEIPAVRKMDTAVSHLSTTYQELRHESRRTLEQRKAAGTGTAYEASLLTKALLRHQKHRLFYSGILRLINTAIQAFPALLVARLLRLVEAGNAQPVSAAVTAALTLVAVLSVKMITENQYFHSVVKLSTQVRGSLAGLIFEKALRLPDGGSGITSQDRDKGAAMGVGGVLNLMQSDTSLVEMAALQIHTTWDGLLQLAMYTYLLYRFLGNSVFYGIAVLLTTLPLNILTLRILNRLSRRENAAKDARNKSTSESLTHMKLLKLYGWEHRFADSIRDHRSKELSRHASRGVVRAINSAISNAVPSVVLVVTMAAYARTGHPVVASTIFTAISLFNQLRFPLFFYPMLIDSLANGQDAMLRIANFLAAEEIVPYVEKRPPLSDNDGGGGSIEMKNGNFLWAVTKNTVGNEDTGADNAVPALANIELSVQPGEIVAVVGSVGSGKSALLKGLLGELSPVPDSLMRAKMGTMNNRTADSASHTPVNPSVITHGNIAYCSQEAWLPKGTIRDAIVFGREFDENRYRQAIYDAGLDRDIADVGTNEADLKEGVLTHDTDVGENGSGLSGGQRARVSLARALYAGDDTTVFLLDDVLAALDANVGSIVFQRLTKRLRERRAAALLVTNDPSIPRKCDKVVLMDKVDPGGSSTCCTIADQGTYSELIGRGHKLQGAKSVDHEIHVQEYPTSTMTTSNATETTAFFTEPYYRGNETEGGFYLHSHRNESSVLTLNDTVGFGYADPEEQASLELCPDSCNTDNLKSPSDCTIDGVTEIVAIYNDTQVEHRSTASEKDATSSKSLSSVDDQMSSGAVPISLYWSYLKAVRSPALVLFMLGSYLTVNGAQFFQQYTVAKWSDAASAGMATAMGAPYLRSLLNAAVVVSVFLWFRSFLLMRVGVRASKFLHGAMLRAVFRAPMSFFSSTSSGTLMSRFGKELQIVDRGVPDSIGSVLFCFLQIFTSIGALAGVITPAMLIPLVGVGFLYVRTMSMFRPAARDMKRAETKTRSPIYTHFGGALRGSATIRSIPGATGTWAAEHRKLTDRNLGVFYTVKAFDRWLSTRLETLGNTVVFTTAIASVLLTRTGTLTAGSAGWGLTQALAITGLLTWAVRCLTDLETNMMSLMRVRELTDLESEEADLSNLPSSSSSTSPRMPREFAQGGEALQPLLSSRISSSLAPTNSQALVKSGWPWRGNISFKNVSMRYNPSAPLVLQNVDLTVPAGTTLGVCGRTGSGKSSLLLTLFRIAEVEGGGSITIDGVDIRSVDLQTLRQSLAIIPQDPTLFQGDVAYNLDATGGSSEEDMRAALMAASPKLTAQFLRGDGLRTAVSEGGTNLSLGQRQLICLARALLRKSRILVLDEATSSVDAETDQEVQETIRREFVNKGVTVITVAHRLDTILSYDKIAVLGAGSLVEYGTPAELLKNPRGELTQLVEADRRNKARGDKQAEKKLKVMV